MRNDHKSFPCSVTEKSGKIQIMLLKMLQLQLPAVISKSRFSARASSGWERVEQNLTAEQIGRNDIILSMW